MEQIVHGTTLGTNILITERGAKVGMITTKGFRDIVEMRRGIRNLHGSMFDMFIEPYKPLVPRDLSPRASRNARSTTARSLTPLNEDELTAAAAQTARTTAAPPSPSASCTPTPTARTS